MFIFSILLRATALVVAGYFVWFAASRSEEHLKTFGKYLALWTFVIAGLYVIGSIAAPYMGMGRFGGRMMGGPMAMRMHPGFGGGMMMARHPGMPAFFFRRHGRMMGTPDQNTQNQPQTQPAQPAQPAPAPSK